MCPSVSSCAKRSKILTASRAKKSRDEASGSSWILMNHSSDQQLGSMSRDPAFCALGGPSRSGLLLFVCCRPLRPKREDLVVSCDSIRRAAKDTINIRSPGVQDPVSTWWYCTGQLRGQQRSGTPALSLSRGPELILDLSEADERKAACMIVLGLVCA